MSSKTTSEIVRSVIIRANDHHTVGDLSELSLIDLVQLQFPMNLAFFYDYTVGEEKLERALEDVLNRYPEMSGRVNEDSTAVILNNAGAKIVFAENSDISIKEMRANNFDMDWCTKHFTPIDEQNEDDLLLKITVQKLAEESGMMINFRIWHLLCDINSCYLLIADFCSLVAFGEYHFDEVIQGNRLELAIPSGHAPSKDHPEVATFDSIEEMSEILNNEMSDQLNIRPVNVTLILNAEKQKQLKSDVYKMADWEIIERSKGLILLPSKNDCMLGIIHQAYAETRLKKRGFVSGGGISYPSIPIAVNIRQRRHPTIPLEQFGNWTICTCGKIPTANSPIGPFEIATAIRKEVGKIDEAYSQSYVDFVSSSKICKLACLFDKTAMRVTNWNKLYDWYGSTDLGLGAPQKMVFLSQEIDRRCIIMPSHNEGDLELHISMPSDQMQQFKEHKNIKTYFYIN